MGYYNEDAYEKMLNKKLKSVELDKTRGRVTFNFQDGSEQAFEVEGDCCSHSWIEHLESIPDVDGATLLAVEDGDAVEEKNPEVLKNHDCLAVYQTNFRTDRGVIALEYRNDSNGYYGGYLVAVS